MATATLTGVLLDATESPLVGRAVSVSLIAGSSGGHTSDGEIVQYGSVHTGVDGSFSIDVESNDAIEPVGSYYRVAALDEVWTVSLPGAGTYVVGDPLIQVLPVAVVPAAVATTGYVDAAVAALGTPDYNTLTNKPTLGSAASHDTSFFDLAGVAMTLANSAYGAAIQRSNHTGTQTMSTISDAGTAATKNVGSSTGTVAAGDDARLSDTRTPTDGSVTTAKLAASAVTSAKIDGTVATTASVTAEAASRASGDALAVQKSANLSDLANAATARTNLGLGTAATSASSAFDASGAASAAQAFAVQRANHTGTQLMATISDAGGAATKNVGSSAGTVAAGDDSRIVGAIPKSLIDAKGDLIVGTANDTPSILTVGADFSKPVADSSVSAGVAYRDQPQFVYLKSGGATTLTSQPAGLQWLGNTVQNYGFPVYLGGFRQVRMAAKVTTVGAAGSFIRVRYTATYDSTQTPANGVQLGAASTEVQCSLAVIGMIDSGWINMVSGAQSDVVLGIQAIGGDGSASPVVGSVMVAFR